jgi:hypothetical protein
MVFSLVIAYVRLSQTVDTDESINEEGDKFFTTNTSMEIDSLLPTTVRPVIFRLKYNGYAYPIFILDRTPEAN